jgi:hypothetical protein
MSGAYYRVEHQPDAPDQWQATWRSSDRSHVTVLVAQGDLDHVLQQIAADAHTRERMT